MQKARDFGREFEVSKQQEALARESIEGLQGNALQPPKDKVMVIGNRSNQEKNKKRRKVF